MTAIHIFLVLSLIYMAFILFKIYQKKLTVFQRLVVFTLTVAYMCAFAYIWTDLN